MRRLIISLLVCSSVLVAQAQNQLSQYEYWFDQGIRTTVALDTATTQELKLILGTKDLSNGLHSLFYRVQNFKGNWSPLGTWMFFVKELPMHGDVRAVKGEYWIDSLNNQRASVEIQEGQMAFAFDGSSLSEGLHSFNYRIQDSEGAYSPAASWMFMQTALRDTSIINKATSCEYWIDGDSISVSNLAMSENSASFKIDASLLENGLHLLNYRIKDVLGNYSPTATWMFFRNELRDTAIVNKSDVCEYWFDDDTTTTQRIRMVDNEVAFSADASKLAMGAHTISFRVRDIMGNCSMPQSWVFVKNIQKKGKRIAWYKSWWNNNVDKAAVVKIDADTTAYVFSQQIEVPDYAKRDGFSNNSKARFSIVFGDDMGNVSRIETVIVSYTDRIPPVSTIEVIERQNDQVYLKWYANEEYIEFYNIYVSENSKPFVLWLPNETKTTAVFKMKKGVSYRFIVTACDKVGNMECYDESRFININ